jgi:hypothetical protein
MGDWSKEIVIKLAKYDTLEEFPSYRAAILWH